MNLSGKIKVAVLRGGTSNGYFDSLKTGAHVLSTLKEMDEDYESLDIFISREGDWHREGIVQEPHKALAYTDVVWNALPGSYGAEGQVERMLQSLQIPFTGSSAVASAISMNRDMSKRLYRDYSLLTPAHDLITSENFHNDQLLSIFQNYLFPVVLKSASRLSNELSNEDVTSKVTLFYSIRELEKAIKELFKYSPRVMVEEFIKGEEVSCLVIEGARGDNIYALIPSSKSGNKLRVEENKKIEEMAKLAHESLGLRHYSSSDFIISPKKRIYILETHSLPSLHKDSHAHMSLEATGWRSRDFVDHVLKLAL